MALGHNVLYAPWRKEYWKSVTENGNKKKTCIFCKCLEKEIIFSSLKGYIIPNKFPYAAGHLLIIPKRHVSNIVELTSKEREDIFNLIDLAVYTLDLYMKPDGYNIGCNIGKGSGGSIDHLHFHVLPRYVGDVGFTRIFNTDIISVSPENIIKDLKKLILKHKIAKKFNIQ